MSRKVVSQITIMLITDFPSEILGEIFIRVVSTVIPSHFTSDLQRTPAPFTPDYHSPASPYSISHVCRQWRAITLQSCPLWTHLRIVSPTGDVVHLASEWIKRAGALPLHLFFYDDNSSESHRYIQSAFMLFVNSISQCKSFQMEILSPLHSVLLRDKLKQQTPALLESLSIRLHHFYRKKYLLFILRILGLSHNTLTLAEITMSIELLRTLHHTCTVPESGTDRHTRRTKWVSPYT